jgi:hypothetical protein
MNVTTFTTRNMSLFHTIPTTPNIYIYVHAHINTDDCAHDYNGSIRLAARFKSETKTCNGKKLQNLLRQLGGKKALASHTEMRGYYFNGYYRTG